MEGLRQRGDSERLLEALERLVELTPEDADEASLLRLELASLARDAGQDALPARRWKQWWSAVPRALATAMRWKRWSRCSG